MPFTNLYYSLKPMMPRWVQLSFRRFVLLWRLKKAQNVWPIKESAGIPPSNWMGWPDGKQFAVVITHDVETAVGIQKVRALAEIDSKYGFKSSFNIVPCKYYVPDTIRTWLTENGFEIGVHDYNHDGKLYRSKEVFDTRAKVINEYLKKWQVTGFRSAAMHHNLEWLSNLDIQYDCSTFDTDPFEPQSDGVNTIFPFSYQNEKTGRCFVEIPYTLPQDFTLFVLKKEKDCSIWKEKLKWIAEKGGMALVIVHPDYMLFKNNEKKIDCYSSDKYSSFLEHITSEYNGHYWNPLPKELAEFVTKRSLYNGNNELYVKTNPSVM